MEMGEFDYSKVEDLSPWLALGRAVLLQAFRDLQSRNGHSLDAAAWLRSEQATLIADGLGLNPEKLKAAARLVLDGPDLDRRGRAWLDQL